MSTMIRFEVGSLRRLFNTVWHIFLVARLDPRPESWGEFFEVCKLNWQLDRFYYPKPTPATRPNLKRGRR